MTITEVWDLDSNFQTIEFVDDDTSDNEIVDNVGYVDFDLSYTEAPIEVPEQSILVLSYDQKCYEVREAHTRLNKQLTITKTIGNGELTTPVWSSSNTTIAKVNQNGYVQHVGNGSAVISVTANNVTKSLFFDFGEHSIPTYYRSYDDSWVVINYAAAHGNDIEGWLRKELVYGVDSRLTDGTDMAMYTTMNHSTPQYVRNPNCWVADLDLTCISPWNSSSGNRKGGALVTSKHLLYAQHYKLGVGTTVRFVTQENEIITRTIVAQNDIASSDITIGRFDTDLPETITPCKVMPEDLSDYLPFPDRWVPMFGTNQLETAYVNQLYELYASLIYTAMYEATDQRVLYTYAIAPGDSGSPNFFILNNELILLHVQTTILSGSAVHKFIDEINTVIAPYILTEINLNAFNTKE